MINIIYSSWYYHHQIGCIHLSYCYHIFRGCVPDMFLHHILSLITYTFRENRKFVLIIIVQLILRANSRIRFGLLIVFVCLYITPFHYHYGANLSEDIELTKGLSAILFRLCVGKISIFSKLSIIQYMGLCVSSLPIFLVIIERINILCLVIIIFLQILSPSTCSSSSSSL